MSNSVATEPQQGGDVLALFKYLRVADVSDALDGIGYFDLCLMAPELRPLWAGMKFWGEALTVRCVPTNRPMWKLNTTEEIVGAHGAWFREMGNKSFVDLIQPGTVVVTDTGGAREVGFWGSENSLNVVSRGGVGIVTNGCARDTAELTLQKTPMCCRARGRTIIPGRIEVAEVQAKIGCGGVQVNPGDVVGCDDDGILVVPRAVAEEVAVHARAVLLADMRARRKHYERLGMPLDETVDYETVERYFEGR
ncbi:MAG TPA: RraA family protein [Armatimonadaceae bacterium]|nr:RraA family protein [Armatimonadaceae bacterium]